MKQVLEYIATKNQAFSCCRMFAHMRDQSIPPKQRLSFAPCMAHFVFSFMDMNRELLRDETSEHPYQKLVNVHTEEDAHHWPWYLHDLSVMGLDKPMLFSEALRFLWSNATRKSRLLTYEFARLALSSSPAERLAIVETVETTGNTFLSLAAEVSLEIVDRSRGKHVYYGPHHARCESGHTMGTSDIEEYLHAIELTDEERRTCTAIVDKLFFVYSEFTEEAYAFVTQHALEDLQSGTGFGERLNEARLPEAQILRGAQL